jgi:chromosome segregation ATPase
MNDFEILRQVLEFYEGEYKGSADAALDRIEAQAAADAELEAEVERLREENQKHWQAWTVAEAEVEGAKEHHELHHAEVERLQVKTDALQVELDNSPTCVEVERLQRVLRDADAELEAEREARPKLEAEVERLRSDNEQHLKQWTQDVDRLRAENRLLQAEVDGAPLGWHPRGEA